MTTTKKPQADYLTRTDDQPNWGAFDAFTAPPVQAKPEQHAGILRTAGDMAIKGAQGVVDLGSAAVGLGSLATGGLVGEGMRGIGYDPKRTNEFLGDYLSDDQKASDAAVQGEDSFLGSAAAAITHPRALAGSIVESLPGMIAGMGASSAAARAIGTRAAAAFGGMETEAGAQAAAAAIEKAGGKLMAVGSATEGAQSAGQIADDAQAAGRTYGQYAPAAVAAGLGTAAIGFGAGKLMGDAATDIATGSRTLVGSKAAKIGKEFVSEGVLEEMPQSAQEQYFTNIAQGEADLGKGVANAAGSGLVTGGVMGAGMGLIHGDHGEHVAPIPAPAPLADTGPLSRAANAVQAATATQAAIAAAAAPVAPAASTTAAPAGAPALADIDARMAQLVAIGRGTNSQRVLDADGNKVEVPGTPGRLFTPAEKAEYDSLKQARAARVAIPQDQQAEYESLAAQEQAERDQKFQPAMQAAAAHRAATEQAVAQGSDDAEHAQIAAMVQADEQLRHQTELARQQQDLNDINARVAKESAARAEANRNGLRDDVLADSTIPADGKKSAFANALKREGYRSTELTPADHHEIDAAIAPLPSVPNELVDAVPERRATAPVASSPNTQAVDAAIASGMRLKSASGTMLHKPGSTKIFRLSTAQRAYYDKAIERHNRGEAAPAAQIAPAAPANTHEMAETAASVPRIAANESPAAELAAPATPLDVAAHEAATSPLNDLAAPTAAQKEAGNYKVGRVRLHGLDLSIENPTGSTRSGVDKAGKPWETTMQHHYGYIRGTVGADKDHIDTFIGPNHDSDKVFVVDQIHPDSGKFDEHKVMLGFDSLEQARAAYQANYDAGWTGGRNVTETTVGGFKAWIDGGKTKKPFVKLPAASPVEPAASKQVDTIVPAPATSTPLTKQDLNKMTVKDMSDAHLLQARDVFADSPRAPKIEKEIAARGIGQQAAAPAETGAPGVLANATAPEHVQLGVDDREMSQIVQEFNDAQAEMIDGEHAVSNVFQPPKKGEVVRLADKAKSKLWNPKEVKAYNEKLDKRDELEAAGKPVPAELVQQIADFEALYLPHVAKLMAEAKAEIGTWKEHAQAQGENAETRRANGKKIVLSLFDLSGEWSKPWEEAGYQVYRFDIQDDPEVGDVNNFSTGFFGNWFGDFDGLDVHAILAATPCTDFASSGARHFAAKDKDGRTVSSIKLVHQTLNTIEYFKPAVWALENPVGRIEKLGGLPPWRLAFDPNQLGDSYTKKTLLWGRFNADLPVAPVEPTEGSKMHRQYGGKSMATKNARSVTPEGFSYGFFMANNVIDHPAMAIANKYDRLDRSGIEQAIAAGVTEDQINEAVEDHYYMDLDDDAANAAVRELTAEAKPDPAPAPTKPTKSTKAAKEAAAPTPAPARPADIKTYTAKEAQAEWTDSREYKRGVIMARVDRRDLAAKSWEELTADERKLAREALDGDFDSPSWYINNKGVQINKGSAPAIAEKSAAQLGDERGAQQWEAMHPNERHSALLNLGMGIGEQADQAKYSQWHQMGAEVRAGLVAQFDRKENPQAGSAEDLPAPTNAEMPAAARARGADNKIFTLDAAEKARAVLRAKLGQLNSGIDPEMMQAGIMLAGFHIEAGARSFADFAKTMVSDLGENIRPFLRSFYEGVRHYPGIEGKEMTAGAEIDAILAAEAAPAPAALAKVVGTAPKAEKKAKAEPGNAALRGDYGVDHIDGYAETDEFPAGPGGDYPSGGVKAAFMKNAQRYLKDVAGNLLDHGYAPATDGKGKPMKPVNANESGAATAGDVSLAMFNAELGQGIYVHIGASALRGTVPTSKSGIAVMMRVTDASDPFGGRQNLWMDPALTARDLADNITEAVGKFAPRPKSATLDTNASTKEDNGHFDTGRDSAEALGPVATAEDGAAESGGRLERGDDGRSDGGAQADRGLDGAGVPEPRSGRGRTGESHPAGTGTATGGRLAGARAGRDGKQVSGPDARASLNSELNAVPAPTPATAPSLPAVNFRITDDVRLGQGGEVEKFNDNLAAIRTMRAVEAENRHATPEEQAVMARYVGWGGLANAFPSPESGQFKDAWRNRGPELADMLSPKEYALARRSTLDSHYTSQTVVDSMWAAARRMGFTGGMALESSMGVGNFLGRMPVDIAANAKFVGVEYDNLTARIASQLYPRETILNSGFQDVPLTDGSFDLAIGNPPFGEQSLRFQFKPEINGHSIHNQFFLASLDALKPGGLQVQVVSRYLLDKMDKSSRVMLAKKANLLGAIRLPDTAFKENARTSVVTDVVFLQRLTPAEEAHRAAVFAAAAQKPQKSAKDELERQQLAAQVPDWVNTTTIADPLGGEPMPINSYFARNPSMIMGVQERSGSMAHGNDITVRLNQAELAAKLASAVEALPQGVMVQDQSAIDAAIARHKDMSDALRISLAGHENGSIKLEAGGVLEQVTERETPEGAFELTRRTLSAQSPWSDALYMNSAGQWYTIEAQLGEDGKPAKLLKDGKATKLNVYDRKVFASEADIPTGMLLGQARYERLKQLVALRDMLKEQLSMEADNAPGAAIEANRTAMAAAYNAFVKEHGLISEPANSSLMSNMPDGALVQALEFGYRPAISAARAARIKEKVRPSSATPAPILSKRVILPYEAATSADSFADAIAINMAESGRVDIDRIASLLGKTAAQVAEDIAATDRPLLFKDPETDQWATRNDYLSGQVKRKLNAARAARLTQNIIALEEVQPEAWGAENVTALLGSSWVPPTVYADFVQHISGAAARVAYSAATNSYSVNGQANSRANEEEWASPGYSTIGLISDLLNNNQIKVVYHDSDGNAHIHQENTALALLKAKAIASEFTDWVYKDGGRRNQLVDIFNEKFNTRVNRQHDGSHLILPGKVPDEVIAMRRHQKNAIWRGISERFNLFDHAVGAGKTFTGIAAAMERRRMGLSKKPTFVVPNHMVEQFASDVYRLYPGAKVLAAGKKDFEKSRRRKLFAKIATGDFDIVIMPHSSFGFIGIAPETEERYLQVELDAANKAVQDAQAEADANGEGGFRKPFGVKEAERLVDKITARMEKVAGDKSKDRLLTFEQMGIDDLTVDEAHEYKNLFYSSRLTGVKGMGNKTGSQKSFDLYNKVRVLSDSPTGKVTFMTGTPISNSAVEMYNMMRYLAADELRALGLEHFDAWRAQFVSTDAGWEPTETGRLKEVNRLGRTWSNMRSLMDLYYSFTDSVDNDDIKKAYAEDNNGEQFPIPRVTGGDRQSVVIAPTKAQLGLLGDVLEGFDKLPTITDPYERNIARLRLMDRARKVSLDVRAADPSSKSDEKGGKLDVLADNVKRIYDKWDSDRGTQLVFLDRSVPKAKGDDTILKEYDGLQAALRKAFDASDENEQRRVGEKLERFDGNEMEAMRNAQAGGWNAYQQIKDNLIARGVPAAEIRFVQEANNDAQKQALFDAVNDGTVRVLIGSTPRMGAGTNVQQRIVAIHHGDVTWKPSDIEQREGRGIRQGNKLLDKYGIDKFELEILAYATERTIDAKMWSLNSSKLKTINAIRKYDGAFSMDFEDEDSVSMAELAALASGDPLLLERVKLMSEIDKLELLKRQHARKEWGITGQIEDAENAINTYPARITSNQQDLAAIHAGIAAMEEDATGRSVRVEGTTYADGSKARTAVYEAVKAQQGGDEKKKVSISVDGRRLTSLEGAMAAVGSVIGDQQTFLMTIKGKDLIARTDAARAAAEIASAESEDLDPGQSVTVDIGQFRGMTLQATMERDSRSTYTTSLAVVRADGSTLATGDTKPRENADYGTMAMRTAVEDLEKTLNPQGVEWTIGNLQRRIAAAHEALPGLLARKGGGFAQQGELEAKHVRLEAVIKQLSSGPSTPARSITLRGNPLLNADGSYVRQSPALAFSRSRIDSDDQLVNIFSQIAQGDAAFRLPGSDGKTLGAVVGDMVPGLSVAEFMGAGEQEDPKSPVDRVWTITDEARPGMSAWVYRNNKNKEIWLDISNWKEGKRGAQIYQAVATFAKNTGHTFIGDPQGLSDKAFYRRTEHMISSALRHGTTEHLAPHSRQREDIANTAGTPMRPIQWREGDHGHNLREMLVSSYTNILQVFPEIADVQYNFASSRFERTPVRASADGLWADEPAAGERADGQGARSGDARGDVGRGADGRNEGAGQLGRVDATAFTDADFTTAAKSVRDAYDVLFPSARGAFTPPLGVSDLKRAALVGTVLRQEGSGAGRAALDHVSDRLLQRVSPQLEKLLYSRDAEYFRDDGNFLPAVPAGVDAGTTAPVELTGRELLEAKQSTEQLNRELAKGGMEPVRALRVAPNANFALARQIGETLGIKVNFVSKNADFEGVAYKGTAYLADGMRNAELAIAGHETLHALEQSNPELGAKLRSQIRSYLKDGAVEHRQAREFAANGFQDVTHEQAEAEVIADINGAMWMDPVFWSDLAKVDRSLFRSVAYKFMELAAKAIKGLRGSRFDVAALVRDVAAVRAIMVSTWAEHNAQRDALGMTPAVIRSTADASVAPVGAKWLSHQAIAEEVEKRIGQFAHQPAVRIRDSAFGVLPDVARNDRVSGAVFDGAIFLFRDALPTVGDVQRALFHELLHYGVRRFIPKDQYITQMMRLYQRDGSFRKEADRWVATAQGQAVAAEGGMQYAQARGVDEALAQLAEPNAGVFLQDSVSAKAVRTVQRWLANLAEWLGMKQAAAHWRGIKSEEARNLIKQLFAKIGTDAPPTDPWRPGSDPTFRRVNGPFYSALSAALPGMSKIADKTGMVKPDQAVAWLAARQKEGKFKADELQWSGLTDWLAMQSGKVSVDSIGQFAANNGVQVQEVQKEQGNQLPGATIDQVRQSHPDDFALLQAQGFEPVPHEDEGGHLMFWQKDDDNHLDARELRTDYGVDRHTEAAAKRLAAAFQIPERVDSTKYSQYVLPGGENYRELLLTVPDRGARSERMSLEQAAEAGLLDESFTPEGGEIARQQDYQSSHWDEKNVIAHVRFNDRVDADGNKVLFIEELQSDWGQDGLKRGFTKPGEEKNGKAIDALTAERAVFIAELQNPDTNAARRGELMHEIPALNRQINELGGQVISPEVVRNGVAPGPFVTKTEGWLQLGIKRMIAYAAEHGYDKIAFANGEQSADRYDLSKQVDQIRYIKKADGTFDVWASDEDGRALNDTLDKQGLTPEQIGDFLGKEVAKKIVDGAGRNESGDMVLEGIDLRVGGEGMKTFYDKIVPQNINDVLKKLGGGKVESIDLGGPDKERRHALIRERRDLAEGDPRRDALAGEIDRLARMEAGTAMPMNAQTGFAITDAMRREVESGLPLFSRSNLGETLASAAGSIADVRLPANYRVGDLFNSSGKISWWHKTIGTMDNLAKRAPAFARVYDAVQSFIGDVSRYAVVAADLAPTLLPKLENIADIVGKNRKKPLTATDTKAIGAPIFEGTLAWARDAHGNPIKIADLEAQAALLTTRQKAQILIQKGVIDDAQNQAWLRNPLDFYDKIIDGKFTETQLKAGVVWSDAELRSMFNLNDGQVALYHEFRNAIDKSLSNLTISEMVKMGGKDAKGMIEQAVAAPNLAAAADLLRDHFIALAQLHPEQADMHLDTAKQIMNLADKGQDLMDRGYAPLSRFGKYTVYVQQMNDQGEHEQVYFGMFETQYEASKMARDMRAEHPDAQVNHGTISEDAYKLFAGVSPETIELFGSMVGLDSQADAKSTEVYQTYLKLAKNNRSSMKRLIARKGIAGFSEDAGRVLAGFVYSNARLTAGNAHLGEIDEAVIEIPKQQGELTDAAMQLREHIRNPEGGGSKLGGLMFSQFLGGSVASAMVNLTQPFTMTLPFLSQWGGIGKAGKRLASAIRDAGKETTGDAGLDAALKWASDEGIVAPQEVHYLQAQAQGKGALRAGDGTRAGNTRAHLNNVMSKVSLGWGKLFAMAELTNRRVTFIAAYRTAVEEGQPNPERFAEDAVSQTQGVYNSGNKPKWARGAIGGLLLTFKQYSIGYLELLSRMAFAGEPGSKERAAGQRGALYMVAVLFLMSGADGLPFEQDLEDALDGILQRLGYNFSTKRSKQAFLTDVLGQGGADFALKGISSMPGMPVDVSGRFGMGNLIPGTGLLTKKQSYSSDLGELVGPAGDLAKRAFSASGKALGGDLMGAATDLSPASVRNVAKGVDMLDTGAYRDARGYIVNKTTPSEAIMKMIGFQPNSTADIQDQKGQALDMISQNRMRSTEIAEHWAQGLANANPDMVQEARDMRADWNAKNPETPIKVDLPAIIRRVRAMKQDALARTQKTAPAALKQTVRAELANIRG